MQEKAEKEAEAKSAKEEREGGEGRAAETGRQRQVGVREKWRRGTETDGVMIAILVLVVRSLCSVLTAPKTRIAALASLRQLRASGGIKIMIAMTITTTVRVTITVTVTIALAIAFTIKIMIILSY